MKQPIKLTLMFLPLLLVFIAIYVITQDAKAPQILTDKCQVLAAGPAASEYQKTSTFLYSHGENPLYHLALNCRKFSKTLMVNDEQLMHTPIKRGQEAELLSKHYRFLPHRWIISVHTGEQSVLEQVQKQVDGRK